MALKGTKVLEFVGLAPGPFCGKILADFGATVTRIDRAASNHLDVLQHGKRTLAVDLKHRKGQDLIRRLAKCYDVLIETFRPGVMERLNLGPEVLCNENPRLIYARLTGFGQSGILSQRAGHDINYIAVSGVLSLLGSGRGHSPPANLVADFAGGGLMCALGVCLALLERHRSGHGQVIDAAMVDGCAYLLSWVLMSQKKLSIWDKPYGENILDGGAFYYNVYETKDGRYMSVGALEPEFFAIFKEKLNLPDLSQHISSGEEQAQARNLVKEKFLQKTQKEWCEIFGGVDACVLPVLNWREAAHHQHNAERKSFKVIDDIFVPKPAPHLSRTPGLVSEDRIAASVSIEEVREILKDVNITTAEIEDLAKQKILHIPMPGAKL